MLSSLINVDGTDDGVEARTGGAKISMSCHAQFDLCSGVKIQNRQAKWLISKIALRNYSNNSDGGISSSSNSSSSNDEVFGNSIIELCTNGSGGGDGDSNIDFIKSRKVQIVDVINELTSSKRINSLDAMSFATGLSSS